MPNIIELPPQCFICRDFDYRNGSDELYCCKAIGVPTNDIYEMWDECPYINRKYLIREEAD